MTKLKICVASAEVAPFAKTGGLADVAAGLTRFLSSAGHDARLFVPLYGRVRRGNWDLRPALDGNLCVRSGGRDWIFSIYSAALPQSSEQVYFLDCGELFDRDAIYTAEDDALRFGLYTRACLEVCQRSRWAPDVFHCNDWHTGLLPLYLKTLYRWDRLFEHSRTLLTVHNIGYQGNFADGVLAALGLEGEKGNLHDSDIGTGRVGFLKTGLLHSDLLTTVSETYAAEIQGGELGMGLEGLLRRRSDALFGIVNGVDYGEWDPSGDELIAATYSARDLSGKARCKQALMHQVNLPWDPDVPVFGVISRLTAQKGFELFPDILPVLLQEHDLRLVVLGSGEERYESYFQWLRDTYSEKVSIYRGYNNELAHRIEAGSDVFCMPSRYEPCGLNQMYSLRYGTVPLVRRTGGLADTVADWDPGSRRGTGFVFDEFRSEALLACMRRALATWTDQGAWTELVRNGMAQDWSWDVQGPRYVDLYTRLAASSMVR